MGIGRPVQPRRRYSSGGRVRYIRTGGGVGDQYADALASANAANEQRYQQLLSGYQALGKRAEGYLEGQGESERQDIQQRYRDMASNTYNTLVNRGFANSSLLQTANQGNQREMNRELQRVGEAVNRQKLDADMAISDRLARVIEGRMDSGPDINQMLQLSQGMGRYGGQQQQPMYGPYNMAHPLRQQAMANMMNPMAAWGPVAMPMMAPMQVRMASRKRNNRQMAAIKRQQTLFARQQEANLRRQRLAVEQQWQQDKAGRQFFVPEAFQPRVS